MELTVDGTPVTGDGPPWRARYPDPAARRRALERYCEELYGFVPFDVVDLDVPEAGLTGVAFVLPEPVSPTARSAHRVYLKRMLLAEGVEGLLPEWAFFARCVVDAGELRPTASREALYEDELLDATRHGLGDVLRQWLVALAETDPARLRAFLRLHQLGVKAMALHDDDMLRIVDRWLEYETSAGPMTLHEFRRRTRTAGSPRAWTSSGGCRRWRARRASASSTAATCTTPRSSSGCPRWTPTSGSPGWTRRS